MTVEEMIAKLEALKDSFSDGRRDVLTEIQNSLRFISTEQKVVEKPIEKIVEVEKPVEKKVEVPVPAPGDRREEPRDPGEIEQRKAKKMKLA